MLRATLFDFGGVILSSPFEAFAAYEEAHDLPPGFLRMVNATDPDGNAWARLERSEVSLAEFGLLTNNFLLAPARAAGSGEVDREAEMGSILSLFHGIFESSKVGVRKPDPRFYELACEQLGVEPEECVFLDDLGVNLKPARALGMATIKVVDPDVAIAELESVVGFPLG